VTDLDELLDLALSIVVRVMPTLAEARAKASADPHAMVHATKSTNTDMVTEMDLWAERYITDALVSARPLDAIIGEEGTRRDGSSDVQWYVDPIDGTKSFSHGVPLYSNLLAMFDATGSAVGVINVPALDEVVYAARGAG